MDTRLFLTLAALSACNLTTPAEPTFTPPTEPPRAAQPTPAPVRGDPVPARQEPPPTPPSRPAFQDVRVQPRFPDPTTPDPRQGRFSLAQATAGLPGSGELYADIETSMGTFSCKMLTQRAPNTVANFVGLARGLRDFWDPVEGRWVRRPFYDGSVFHRVIPEFMIQGGDILRSGRGGPGYEFADENVNGHDRAGLLCMANHGPNTNGSQFFITEAPRQHLDGTYSIFGECTPTDLVNRIARVPRNDTDMPLQPVRIEHVRVTRR